jgi:hypothetical protein
MKPVPHQVKIHPSRHQTLLVPDVLGLADQISEIASLTVKIAARDLHIGLAGMRSVIHDNKPAAHPVKLPPEGHEILPCRIVMPARSHIKQGPGPSPEDWMLDDLKQPAVEFVDAFGFRLGGPPQLGASPPTKMPSQLDARHDSR